MNGGQTTSTRLPRIRVRAGRRRPREEFAAVLGEPEARAEQRLRGNRAERDERGWPDRSKLSGEPGAAGRDVACGGCRVQPPRRRFRGLPAEMLHRVREIDIGAVDLSRRESSVQHLPSGADKRLARRSSMSPGCSPTSIIRDLTNPAPNTTCVADSYRSHPRQTRAARRKSDSRIFSGRNLSAPGYVIPAEVTYYAPGQRSFVGISQADLRPNVVQSAHDRNRFVRWQQLTRRESGLDATLRLERLILHPPPSNR